jgi:hypothetical protein
LQRCGIFKALVDHSSFGRKDRAAFLALSQTVST